MTLLRSATRISSTGNPPVRRGLPLACAATVLVAFTLFAGRAAAGAGDYPSPLYLSGGVSSNVSTSFQLLGGAPPATPATPTVALVGGGSLTGTYNYLVVAFDSGGRRSASLASNSAVASSQNITVGNLPSGSAVDIYRQKSGCAAATNCPFYWVGNSAGATSVTDSLSD